LKSWQSEHNKCKVHLSTSHDLHNLRGDSLWLEVCVTHKFLVRVLRGSGTLWKRFKDESRNPEESMICVIVFSAGTLTPWEDRGECLTAGDKAVKVSDKFSFTSGSRMCWSIRCHYWLRYTRVPIVVCLSFIHSIQCICIIMQ